MIVDIVLYIVLAPSDSDNNLYSKSRDGLQVKANMIFIAGNMDDNKYKTVAGLHFWRSG